jgi:hypothetical protein
MSMPHELSDDISIDSDSDSQESESTSHSFFTRSQRYSSPAVPISVALDPFRAPLPSVEEMNSQINRLRMTVDLMQKELIRVTAQFAASKARCAMMRTTAEANAELDQEKPKSRQAIKTDSRYVTLATTRAQWAAEQGDEQAQKRADDAALYAIRKEMRERVFSGAS